MLNRIINKLSNILLYRRLPSPSRNEIANISELQDTFSNLPKMETVNASPSEQTWLSNINRLKELILKQNPRKFLKWDVVKNTMFVSNVDYISTELRFLKSQAGWDTRWKNAIKESFVGNPTPYIFYPSSSGNLIHHAYHLSKFEEKTRVEVENMDFIFEFGGGYGSMCRLFHNLGFRGKYLIFDLPQFSALQKYYLKTLELPLQSFSESQKTSSGILCISEKEELKETLEYHTHSINKTFLATWSISETPDIIRDSILPLISNFQSFLIAYQDKFEEMNNKKYFEKWTQTMSHVNWNTWKINHLPHSNYLVGTSIEQNN
jgi:hypothetical protein